MYMLTSSCQQYMLWPHVHRAIGGGGGVQGVPPNSLQINDIHDAYGKIDGRIL